MTISKAALTRLLAGFQGLGDAAFSFHDISTLLNQNRSNWGVPGDLGAKRTLAFLMEKNQIREVALPSVGKKKKYPAITRYVQGQPSAFDLAVSIASSAYLCHASALYVHGLTNQIPATIYVNREQSPKPDPDGDLTQAAIDRAFNSPQRRTNYVFAYEGFQIAILSGKNTKRLEVIEIPNGEFQGLPVTSIERTLIDIAVRPDYSGGVAQVAEAYDRAKGRFSVNRLVATLKKLAYVYPYHQVIGFYLSRSNYPEKSLVELRKLGTEFNFHLAHGLKTRVLDPSWRVYRPEWL